MSQIVWIRKPDGHWFTTHLVELAAEVALTSFGTFRPDEQGVWRWIVDAAFELELEDRRSK
jgi:hypothetical protein